MELLVVLVILVAVVYVVTAPLRERSASGGAWDASWSGRGREPTEAQQLQADELAELKAAREAKYREIRDTQMDHVTGKLSAADFEALDSRLRAEAVEILRAIDALQGTA